MYMDKAEYTCIFNFKNLFFAMNVAIEAGMAWKTPKNFKNKTLNISLDDNNIVYIYQ